MAFTKQLQRGAIGEEVKQLQDYLVSKGLMTQAEVNTGYGTYGPKTEVAVAKLQKQLGVDTSGGGVGRFGPRTIQAITKQTPQTTTDLNTGIMQDRTMGGYFKIIDGQQVNVDKQGNPIATDTIPVVAPPVVTPETPTPPAIPVGTTGNTQLDELYKTLKEFVSGKTLNPNIQLTPADLQRFYNQAAQEINPYYASQISAIKDDLTKSIGFLQKSYELEKEQAGAQLKNTLASSREAAAGAGTIFSGARGRQERDLASLYGQNLESKALGLESQIGGQLRGLESKIGSKNIQDLGIPSFQSAGVSLQGEGGLTPGRTLSFAPTGGVTGSLEYQSRGDIRSLADLLGSEEIKKRSRTNIGGLYL